MGGGRGAARMPAVFVNHGGGPLPLLGKQPRVAGFLKNYAASLPSRPRAVLVVTAHWEEADVTVSTAERPGLLFDYGGFPPETYEYKYPAPGATDVAARAVELLKGAGVPVQTDSKRGWDHGVFVPMMLMFPRADVPIVAVSLKTGQDPATHLQMGEALAPLRDEGVLIVGSGFSFHNFGYFRGTQEHRQEGHDHSKRFDAWLRESITIPSITPEERRHRFTNWAKAPSALACHPPGGAEHLIPLHVMAGAGGMGIGRIVGCESGGLRVTEFQWD
eukprot:Hpha_TRINITY_DN15741_c5_g9::TRINITY_DN15741_c5_g9_i1::g.41267::m.41267